MKTIALKEKTFYLLEEMKEKEKASSFDKLIIDIILEKEKIPESMRGELKGKSKRFSKKERNEIWRDDYRKW